MVEHIKYKKGYKYQLYADYSIYVGIFPDTEIEAGYLKLTTDGVLHINKGYAWDGPSGPTWDSPSAMRGSLVHDALYQLMRLQLIGTEHRERADLLLTLICVEDGMWQWRAEIWFRFVRLFAAPATRACNEPEVITAP